MLRAARALRMCSSSVRALGQLCDMRLLGDVQSPYHECVVRFRLRKAEARLIGISMVTGLWRSGFWQVGKLVSGVGVVVTAATFDVDRHWLVCCV